MPFLHLVQDLNSEYMEPESFDAAAATAADNDETRDGFFGHQTPQGFAKW